MSFWYNQGVDAIMRGTCNMAPAGSTLKIALCTATYVATRDDDYASTFTTNEIDVTGYTRGYGGAGRHTLASKTLTITDASDWVTFDAADDTWTTLGAGTTITQAVIIFETGGSDATAPLLVQLDGFSVVTNGGDFTLQYSTSGIARITIA